MGHQGGSSGKDRQASWGASRWTGCGWAAAGSSRRGWRPWRGRSGSMGGWFHSMTTWRIAWRGPVGWRSVTVAQGAKREGAVSHFRRCAAMTWRVSGCGRVLVEDNHDCIQCLGGSTAQLGTHDGQHAWAEKGQDYVQMTREDVTKRRWRRRLPSRSHG